MTGYALETEALSKSFGAHLAVSDVTLRVPVGARQALIGPNGAGKTTIINLVTGVLEPSHGRVRLGGHDVTATSPASRVGRGLSRTFQINTLFPALTPLETVTLATCRRLGLSSSSARRLAGCRQAIDEAYELLVTFGLDDVADRPTRELAYGRQRILEIALALACRPKVLLLDEPAAGIPIQESAELYAVIATLPSDVAVLFIEHDMDLVFRFADRITVLVAGRVLREGTPAEIAVDPEVRAVYLGEVDHG